MARIRTIKPDMWHDESFGTVSLQAQLLFIGLISQSDDEGRQKMTCERLRAVLWPYKLDLHPADIEAWVDELVACNLVIKYSVAEKRYLSLPTWFDHQKINRPRPSLLPSPPEQSNPNPVHGALSEDSVSDHGAFSAGSRSRIGSINPPISPQGGSSRVTFNKKVVARERVELAENVLSDFNELANGKYRAYTGSGKVTGDLRVIIGCVVDFPDVDRAFCKKLIASALQEPWWPAGEPVSPGMIFSPKVVQRNIARAERPKPGSVEAFDLAWARKKKEQARHDG